VRSRGASRARLAMSRDRRPGRGARRRERTPPESSAVALGSLTEAERGRGQDRTATGGAGRGAEEADGASRSPTGLSDRAAALADHLLVRPGTSRSGAYWTCARTVLPFVPRRPRRPPTAYPTEQVPALVGRDEPDRTAIIDRSISPALIRRRSSASEHGARPCIGHFREGGSPPCRRRCIR
jgi:hypothetical protein